HHTSPSTTQARPRPVIHRYYTRHHHLQRRIRGRPCCCPRRWLTAIHLGEPRRRRSNGHHPCAARRRTTIFHPASNCALPCPVRIRGCRVSTTIWPPAICDGPGQ